MIDQLKRNTLKIMAAAGVAAVSPMALSAALPARKGAEAAGNGLLDTHLQIDILAGRSVPEDSVILRNTTTDVLQINAFRPGVIAYKDSILDLNKLCSKQTLVLQPGQLVSFTARLWEEMADSAMHEYLLADNSASAISNDTDVLSLLAMIHDNNAIVMSSGLMMS